VPIHNRADSPARFQPADTRPQVSFYENTELNYVVSRRAIGKDRPDKYLAEPMPNASIAQHIDLLTVFEGSETAYCACPYTRRVNCPVARALCPGGSPACKPGRIPCPGGNFVVPNAAAAGFLFAAADAAPVCGMRTARRRKRLQLFTLQSAPIIAITPSDFGLPLMASAQHLFENAFHRRRASCARMHDRSSLRGSINMQKTFFFLLVSRSIDRAGAYRRPDVARRRVSSRSAGQ